MTWRDRAACRGKPVLLFVGSDRGQRVCAACPVRVECLEDCLSFPYGLPGVWGGTTEEDRRDRARARRIAAQGSCVAAPQLDGLVAGTRRCRHGSYDAYQVHGCRCGVCVAAQRARWRVYARRRSA